MVRGYLFDSSKVVEHHGIVPTRKAPPAESDLKSDQRKLYELIVKRYLANLMPDHAYDETVHSLSLRLGVAGVQDPVVFKATGKTPTDPGFRRLLGTEEEPESGSGSGKPRKKTKADPASAGEERESEDGSESGGDAGDSSSGGQRELPPFVDGEPVRVQRGARVDRKTSPPPYYTQATLLADMNSVGKYVSHAQLKAILKETDWIGTPATQSVIIEGLWRRGYLYEERNKLKASDLGISIITHLPPLLTKPDLTAKWELDLKEIAQGRASRRDFEASVSLMLQKTLDWIRSVNPEGVQRIQGEARLPDPAKKSKSPSGGGKRSGRSGGGNRRPRTR